MQTHLNWNEKLIVSFGFYEDVKGMGALRYIMWVFICWFYFLFDLIYRLEGNLRWTVSCHGAWDLTRWLNFYWFWDVFSDIFIIVEVSGHTKMPYFKGLRCVHRRNSYWKSFQNPESPSYKHNLQRLWVMRSFAEDFRNIRQKIKKFLRNLVCKSPEN